MTAFRLPQIGELVAEKYRVLRVVADGGMGVVFEAQHELLGKSVALKFPLPELAHVPSIVERFLAEARLCARIENEHVVRVLDVSKFDGLPYIVMELVSGASLTAALGTPWALGKACAFAIQILEGLEAVHALGVVHRDVKPDNVLVVETARGPVLKLIDFGIAKDSLAQEAIKRLTHAGAMLGTPAYMAPEQVRDSSRASASADLYSTGIVLFELLGGASPFTSDTVEGLVLQAFTGQMRLLRELAPAVPEALALVVARATALEPTQRFASAREFMDALWPFADAAFLGLGQPQNSIRRSQSEEPKRTVPIATSTPPPHVMPFNAAGGTAQLPQVAPASMHATPAPGYVTAAASAFPTFSTPPPASGYGPPPTQYGAPATQYAEPPNTTQYGAPATQYAEPPNATQYAAAQYGTPAHVPVAAPPQIASISREKPSSVRAFAIAALIAISLFVMIGIVILLRRHSSGDEGATAAFASAPPETDIAPLASEAPDPSASATPPRPKFTTPIPPAAPKAPSAEAVSEAVQASSARFRRCETDPQAAQVTVELHIAPDGSVRSVTPVSSTASPAESACVAAEAQGMRFPPHEGADEIARVPIPLAAAEPTPPPPPQETQPEPGRRQRRFPQMFPGRQRRGRGNAE